MTIYVIYLVLSFVVSLACGMMFIPAIIAFCKKKGLYDQPNARKVHKTSVPRLGGVCFAPCMLLAILLTVIVFNNQQPGQHVTISLWTFCFVISLLLIYSVGLVDDLIGLDAKVKFIVQIVSATLLPAAGLYINNLYGFCGIHEIPYWAGAPLTIFLIVFIDNAINLIDGIDGLSSGLSFLALGGFLVYYLQEGLWLYGILILGLMGVLLAFMNFNIFGHAGRKKIFMGDSGSLTLGFILAFLLVKLMMITPDVKVQPVNGMVQAFSLIIVPIFDVLRVIVVRKKHGRPIFDADKNHIHHKMLRTGLGQHQALVAILLLALFFIVVNNLLLCICGTTAIVVIDFALWFGVQAIINHFIRRNGMPVYLRQEASDKTKNSEFSELKKSTTKE